MSFILDALKKLEREKAARSSAGVNISEGILRGDHRGRRAGKRPATAIAVTAVAALLVIGVVVAGVMFLKRDTPVRETSGLPGEGHRREAVSSLPERPQPPVAAKTPSGLELPPVASPSSPVAAPREIPQMRSPARAPARMASGADPGEGAPERQEVGSPPAGAELKVSGIAWQERRAARRAVVNGQLVPEGTLSGCFTVKEIFQNRVRFQGNGRTFDVYISGPLLGESTASQPSRQPVGPNSQSRDEIANRVRPVRNDLGNFRTGTPASASD